MSESLQLLVEILCTRAELAQQNAQQTLYHLETSKDAKLIYEVLLTCGVDVKLVPEEIGAKLYIQNASVDANEAKIRNTLASASLFKEIKNVLDQYNDAGDYTLSLSNIGSGRQLTLILPSDEQLHGIQPKLAKPTPKPSPSAAPAPSAASPAVRKARPAPKQDDILSAGPQVVRTALPKGMKSSSTDEDSLQKRMMFYLTSRAFTSGAWAFFAILILGLIFSIIVTIRGFLCPDVAMVDKAQIPAYCRNVR